VAASSSAGVKDGKESEGVRIFAALPPRSRPQDASPDPSASPRGAAPDRQSVYKNIANVDRIGLE
jgi:hypothetical protein